MKTFDYPCPRTLRDAAALLSGLPDAQLLAGGMTLIPTLKFRLATPASIVDLAKVPELRGIRVSSAGIAIGAMTTHAEVAAAAEVRQPIPALADLAGAIGDAQVRNRGTLGGSIANNDPAADYPAAVLGFGAAVHTSTRVIAADDFFTGMFETALAPGEIVIEVRFPIPRAAAYEKFKSPASRYALVGVFVALTRDGVRVAVTGAAPCVFRASAIESALAERFAPEALDGLRYSTDGLNSDMHADAAYRANLIGVLARRAVARIATSGKATG